MLRSIWIGWSPGCKSWPHRAGGPNWRGVWCRTTLSKTPVLSSSLRSWKRAAQFRSLSSRHSHVHFHVSLGITHRSWRKQLGAELTGASDFCCCTVYHSCSTHSNAFLCLTLYTCSMLFCVVRVRENKVMVTAWALTICFFFVFYFLLLL